MTIQCHLSKDGIFSLNIFVLCFLTELDKFCSLFSEISKLVCIDCSWNGMKICKDIFLFNVTSLVIVSAKKNYLKKSAHYLGSYRGSTVPNAFAHWTASIGSHTAKQRLVGGSAGKLVSPQKYPEGVALSQWSVNCAYVPG